MGLGEVIKAARSKIEQLQRFKNGKMRTNLQGRLEAEAGEVEGKPGQCDFWKQIEEGFQDQLYEITAGGSSKVKSAD